MFLKVNLLSVICKVSMIKILWWICVDESKFNDVKPKTSL